MEDTPHPWQPDVNFYGIPFRTLKYSSTGESVSVISKEEKNNQNIFVLV